MKEGFVAIEFPTQDAYDKYMKEHPDADKSLHIVKKTQGEDKQRDIHKELYDWVSKSGETGAHTLAGISRWMRKGLSVEDAVAKIYTREERQRRREWGDDLFEQMKKEGKLPWTKYSKGVKSSMNMATELLKIAKELVGVKFDTQKELDEYKRTHGQRPGTRLQVRNKQEMQKRYKDKKAVAAELVKMAKSLVGGGWGRFSEDLSDVLEAQNHIHKNKDPREIFRIIKSNRGIAEMMRAEGMTDKDLRDFLNDLGSQFERTL